MKRKGDIENRFLIHAKGALFVLLGSLSGVLLLIQTPTLGTFVLLVITVWAFCRFYYYLFYVLERYLGRKQRFAGVIDAMRFLVSRPPEPGVENDKPDVGDDGNASGRGDGR